MLGSISGSGGGGGQPQPQHGTLNAHVVGDSGSPFRPGTHTNPRRSRCELHCMHSASSRRGCRCQPSPLLLLGATTVLQHHTHRGLVESLLLAGQVDQLQPAWPRPPFRPHRPGAPTPDTCSIRAQAETALVFGWSPPDFGGADCIGWTLLGRQRAYAGSPRSVYSSAPPRVIESSTSITSRPCCPHRRRRRRRDTDAIQSLERSFTRAHSAMGRR